MDGTSYGTTLKESSKFSFETIYFWSEFSELKKKALFRCSFPESPSGFGKTPQDAIDIKEENSRKYSMDDEGVEF